MTRWPAMMKARTAAEEAGGTSLWISSKPWPSRMSDLLTVIEEYAARHDIELERV